MSALFIFFSVLSIAQNKITVSGVVKDKDGNPVTGTTIETGKPPTPIGKTDDKGQFSVTVNAGSVLVFTHTGYNDVSRTVLTSGSIEVTIQLKNSVLQEVVVQGFRTKTRETSTSSSTVISGKSLQDVPVANVAQLLQGKASGLNVQVNSGSPGGMVSINLRGVNNNTVSSDGFITPTSPLFVVDGVQIDMNSNYEYGFQSGGTGISPLALIPPEDIQQMDILRDAAATSVYGSKGAYGVILITTKRGQSKVPVVQYSTGFFLNTPPKLRLVLGGKEERMARIKAIMDYDTTLLSAYSLINNTSFLSDSLNPYYNNATDWQNYFFRTTYNQQHNIGIYGGDNKFSYKTNLNYYQENGIVENTGFKRYSLSMNALYQPVSAFRMVVALSGALGQKNNGSGVGLVQTGLAKNARTSSLLPPPSMFSDNNSTLEAASVKDNNKTANISASLDLQFDVVKGIRIGNVLGYNFNSGTSDRFTPSFLHGGNSVSYNYNNYRYNLNNRTTINFTKTFKGVHNFNSYIFNEINSDGSKSNAIELTQTANDQIAGPIGYNFALSKGGTLNNLSDKRSHGYGGSFSYNYDRKYVFDFSFRMDGLSTNGPSRGYTQNPAVSFRWNFNKERFFDRFDWLDFSSLRASWGRSIIPTGDIFDVYGKYIVGQQYNNNPTVYMDFGVIPNANFLPKTNTEVGGAIEFGLFNRVTATFETYYRSVDNEVISVDLADMNAFGELKSNENSYVNYGFEWDTRVRLFRNSNPFQWDISVNGALNRNINTRLPNDIRQYVKEIYDGYGNVPIVYKIGRNGTKANLMYVTDGVFGSTADVPVNPATGKRLQYGGGNTGFYFQGGDPHWVDINGDYVINEEDLVPVGSPIPVINGGITSYMTYKGFTLNINASYTLIRDILNTAMAAQFQNYSEPTTLSALLPISEFDYWRPSGTNKNVGSSNAKYPNPFDFRRAVTLKPFRTNQTLFMEDGSYWKINTITLSYNLQKALYSKLGMTSCRIALTANNVYTFSNYSGPDPELVTDLGRDISNGYPNARSYSLNISIQF